MFTVLLMQIFSGESGNFCCLSVLYVMVRPFSVGRHHSIIWRIRPCFIDAAEVVTIKTHVTSYR